MDTREITIPTLGQRDVQANDAALREDVRHLGATVGEMLAEQVSEAFLTRVETLRTAAITRRQQGQSVEALAGQVVDLPVELALDLTRAFSTYFQAVNIGERVHRIRRRREYQHASEQPQPDGLLDVLRKLKASGVSADELIGWIERLNVEPVFTAHPTEAQRRALLEKEQEIVRCLINGFDASRTPWEIRGDWERLRMALTAGWQTSETAPVKPSVQDEFEHVGFYLGGPLYRVVPVFYEQFEDALHEIYGVPYRLPTLLHFASWVGGDMDGNPNVGADTIRATLRGQREMILDRYASEVSALASLLSQTRSRTTVTADLDARIERYQELLPKAAAAIRPRHADMPYRVLLTLMRARIRATQRDDSDGYPEVGELEADLQSIIESLRAAKGEHAGLFAVRRLMWRVKTFGFHLARLDVRQDSRIHAEAVGALLADPQWATRAPEQQLDTLRAYAGREKVFPASNDVTAQRTRAVFVALADAQETYGPKATGLYIISMAKSAADVFAVLALARYGGLVDARGNVPLDVAPLFETVDDLKRGPEVLQTLLADPVYRLHLAARGNRQMVMLGYSDSGKDGGTVASRWGLQRAQVELLEIAREHNVALSFFHGRGGSASRGGGRVMNALMASPRGSVAGRLRVTEQGEVIHRKYGIRALALREIEQSVAATLRASLRPRIQEPREAEWKATMAALSQTSREAYRGFVGDERFVEYFRLATPIDVIERMTLGSRPSRRGTMKGVESLRAIPWVFAWTQCRAIITGWYGLGSALERSAAEFGESRLHEMVRDWAFFRTMLDDIDMVLAKCDLDVALQYSRLAGELHEPFFSRIRDEFERTVHWVLRIKRSDRLLAADPRLAESIRLRNPYVDPINLLQVDLLQRWRAGSSEDDELLAALVATVNGIAQGLQNTG
ncbi:phosphoenolpyruvate carboxylase [Solimonas marina]|uniref:Phosphoenolpyruvate carboxylase n=1 Tax=Solimonas marina TaxID=2714601 RepID=A0A970B9B4_9GAMM|nr:phosphoenolpyruvate carboxylase [Solimonas marina]NKF22236.1 phosphoenolpyruvate carboxylase [Solimonas marina]